MKDIILNSLVIATLFSAIVLSAMDDLRSAPQTVVVHAPRLVEMERTVVAARRLPSDVARIGTAG